MTKSENKLNSDATNRSARNSDISEPEQWSPCNLYSWFLVDGGAINIGSPYDLPKDGGIWKVPCHNGRWEIVVSSVVERTPEHEYGYPYRKIWTAEATITDPSPLVNLKRHNHVADSSIMAEGYSFLLIDSSKDPRTKGRNTQKNKLLTELCDTHYPVQTFRGSCALFYFRDECGAVELRLAFSEKKLAYKIFMNWKQWKTDDRISSHYQTPKLS